MTCSAKGKWIKKNCNRCDNGYKDKGIETKNIISLLGEIKINRKRYRCSGCHNELYPLDEQLELSRMKVSKRFAKAVSQIAIFTPFEHERKMLIDLLDISASVTLLEQIIKRFGTTIHRQEEKKSQRSYATSDRETDIDVLYIEADGAMVPLWSEQGREFKENKLGIVFNNKDIEQRITKNLEMNIFPNQYRYLTGIMRLNIYG